MKTRKEMFQLGRELMDRIAATLRKEGVNAEVVRCEKCRWVGTLDKLLPRRLQLAGESEKSWLVCPQCRHDEFEELAVPRIEQSELPGFNQWSRHP